jgi:hypothetical protein
MAAWWAGVRWPGRLVSGCQAFLWGEAMAGLCVGGLAGLWGRGPLHAGGWRQCGSGNSPVLSVYHCVEKSSLG